MSKIIDTVEEYWGSSDLSKAAEAASERSISKFKEQFADFFASESSAVFLFKSGREALQSLIASLSNKNGSVWVPEFNCPAVLDAIKTAEADIEFYPLISGPPILKQLSNYVKTGKKIKAVIITHYFGAPIDFTEIISFCRAKRIVIIEDCAHTFGGKIRDNLVGTIGDASIFSFNYDKPISLGGGGAALVNNKAAFRNLRENLLDKFSHKSEVDRLFSFSRWLKAKRQWIKYEGTIFHRISKKLPSFIYDLSAPEFNEGFSQIQAQLGLLQLRNFAQVKKLRNENAKYFSLNCNLPSWTTSRNCDPSWLKQKVGVSNLAQRQFIQLQLRKKGIRAGVFNWPRLISRAKTLDEWQSAENLLTINWLDIPIHQNMTKSDIDVVLTVINEAENLVVTT